MKDILNDIGGPIRIDYSVKQCCINVHTDVVSGVYYLIPHVNYLGFELDSSNVLSKRIVVVESRFEGVFEFAKLFNETESRSFNFFVVAAASSTDIPQTC